MPTINPTENEKEVTMIEDNEIVNNDEQIVMIREIVQGEGESTFYAIRDVHLGYWRTREPLHDDKAWTQDRHLRAEFDERGDALEELLEIWRVRRAGQVRPEEIAELEFEMEAVAA
ncbi:MAG: hypothetical protein WC058_02785 [Phycisphaeraceae bacterium]